MANTSKRLGQLSSIAPEGEGGGGGYSTGFVKPFTIGMWTADTDNYYLQVPESEHLRGVAPSVAVFELDGSYISVFAVVEVSNAGLVTIRVSQVPDNRFAGKLIIS